MEVSLRVLWNPCGKFCLIRVSCQVSNTCNALGSLVRSLKPKADRVEDDDGDDDDEQSEEEDMMSMVKDLIENKKGFRASSAATSEAFFTEKHIMPSIRRLLLKDASQDHYYAM
ncbi:hypothetical protein RMATCC62417_13085 [Rhizopus microsporus]|nr:hypothetical protein RMATCC62417_13085 [Rhizopus microsporus]